MTKVSVVIPTYNEEKTIRDCLTSLAKQNYKEVEIIVIDDGSTDRTVASVLQINQLTNQSINLLRQKHQGAGAARNLGVKHAKGEILVFVDSDMTFHKDFIKNLVRPIIDAKTIGTFSKEEYLANKDNVWARCWNINRGLPPEKMHIENYPNIQKVFRAILKEEFGKAGGFDEKAGYTDDWSLSEKLGIEAVAAPGAIFYHKNPETLSEIFIQSKWMAKRRYKLGALGSLVALIRVSFPISLIVGMLLATYYMLPEFFVFKIVSDFGAFIGILEYLILGKISK